MNTTETVYTLTTTIPRMGYCDLDVRTLTLSGDTCTLRSSGPAPVERVVSRADAAETLRRWRAWARTCPDQEVDRCVF